MVPEFHHPPFIHRGRLMPELQSAGRQRFDLLNRIIAIVLLGCCSAAQLPGPERRVQKNVIVSQHDPKLRIELPRSVEYVGADRWALYDIADCELHAFVEADSQKNVQRLYWVQFEGYLPSKPDLKHTYDSPMHTTLGGLDFYVDTWARTSDEKNRAGSDREHIEALVYAHGYRMPRGMIYVRLVHLVDNEKRKELMIIYGEDLAATGLTAGDLREGGKAHDRWPPMASDLVERARTRIQIEEAGKS